MDTKTNELYDLSQQSPDQLRSLLKNPNLKLVPPEHQVEAKKLLKGRRKIKVHSKSGLIAWARKVRRNNGIKETLICYVCGEEVKPTEKAVSREEDIRHYNCQYD